MKQSNDSLGRTVMIAVIAGLLFAGFLALTPRLTAGTQTKGEPVAPADVGNLDTALGTTVSDPVVAIADVGLDGGMDLDVVRQDWSDQEVPAPEDSGDETDQCVADNPAGYRDDDYKRDEDPSQQGCACECGDTKHDGGSYEVDLDGTLEMSVEIIGPNDAKESMLLFDEDTVEWRFRVENAGDEELWGVYAYFEGYGQAHCDTTYLAPGETTDCWAETEVWEGSNTADAWATAWTTTREVGVELSYHYMVAP